MSCGGFLAGIFAISGIYEALTNGAIEGTRRNYHYYYSRADDPSGYWGMFILLSIGLAVSLALLIAGLNKMLSWMKN